MIVSPDQGCPMIMQSKVCQAPINIWSDIYGIWVLASSHHDAKFELAIFARIILIWTLFLIKIMIILTAMILKSQTTLRTFIISLKLEICLSHHDVTKILKSILLELFYNKNALILLRK